MARVALAYAAAGWLLVQVVSTMLVPLGLPDWALRFIIVPAIAGFFVAVAVAWGFGTGKDPHADVARPVPEADADRASAPRLENPPAAAPDPSVAVLAFADMSPGRDQGYFCEGAAEEIINALAGVRGLRVASRSGSFQFKDRAVDNREVARLLSVRAVLDESRRFSERAVALRPDDPQTHCNAACTAALSGQHEAALDLLERAIALGWSNARWLMNDDDLVPLHDHPRFKQIVAGLE